MVECVARKLHQSNLYVVNRIGKKELMRLLSLANVLHCENPLKVEEEWIKEYQMTQGSVDVLDVNTELDVQIPRETQMGKVYTRLILDTDRKSVV